MEPYWEPNGHASHPVKYESEAAVAGFPYCTETGLNFSTTAASYGEDDGDFSHGRRGKTSRQDPLSHRIIEKRRRDRMNSCLADLSRLIPPQYQRKGRGRIEKTEIIEMAIRHLKHLQNECAHKDIEYKLGYSDCMKEAAKFLYDSHMQDFCYRLLAHLQEHCDEIMKSDCFKARCNMDTISASSGSPPAHTNYHTGAPLSQLRDMLTSDIEHSNSNDHNDVKDLSFRSQPHQAPVITSTAPLSIHHDSSNPDFESSREPLPHHENGTSSSSPPPSSHHLPHSNDILRTVRMRNFSESSHDIEHNNNYKYKNHIKQRFNQDSSHIHDESASDHQILPPPCENGLNSSEHSKEPPEELLNIKKRKIENCENLSLDNDNFIGNGKCSNNNNNNNNTTNCNNNTTTNSSNTNMNNELKCETPPTLVPPVTLSTNQKLMNNNGSRHFAVPIFALHGQGTYYVPLNIDYETLLPYLHGVDLLDKNYNTMPILHPISINVNFIPPNMRQNNLTRTKIEAVTNGCEAAVAGFPYCTETGLNFSTTAASYGEDDGDFSHGRRGKTSRQDPLSHRIIEKRRRDRMNSCLADLSRLIPPQYQRKGRGRIEKTEIIEMAIRHLKHLQNECAHKDIEYKLGYSDCMKEAAKFLYDSHMQDFCYRLLAHLQEHCDEIMKSDCFKARCNMDTISASSGSPPAHTNYHTGAPLSQLRDMLTSDIEHSNSNDHNDVKDLSFRSQPHQAPVITSTAPLSIHHDSSNPDFESSREPLPHHENGTSSSSPPPSSHHLPHSNDILRTVRMRNFSESSHDIEHNNNYKYKNHIKQRFNQDSSHIHDESASDHQILPPPCENGLNSSEHSKEPPEELLNIKKRKIENCENLSLDNDNFIGNGKCSNNNNNNNNTTNCNNNTTTNSSNTNMNNELKCETPPTLVPPVTLSTNQKLMNNNGSRHFAVPIFALHGQGTYYVPLNIDYETLLPYLHGVDLLDKNYNTMPILHPISINVNFIPPNMRQNNLTRTKIEAVTNGW